MNCNYIFLADGFEDIEALTVVDVLRRAGMTVDTVSINGHIGVTSAHGVIVLTDDIFTSGANFNDADWLILPGGMPGATNLHECDELCSLLKTHAANGGNIAAICAAPAVVLAPLGILQGRKATCYPGFESACVDGGALMNDTRVVVDDNIITANGPSSALPFALAIVSATLGDAVSQQVASGMLCQ